MHRTCVVAIFKSLTTLTALKTVEEVETHYSLHLLQFPRVPITQTKAMKARVGENVES